ncbi:MAG: hypothetical protein Q8861_09800 [Bacteroidota bacterium]|nr:hypothetical protein [Bacteroidota bacterium]
MRDIFIVEVSKRPTLFKIISVRFYGIAPLIVAIFGVSIIDFDPVNKVIFSIMIALMIFYNVFCRKKYRNISRIQIDFEKQEIYLQYYQYVITHAIDIPFSQLNYTYTKELYGYTSVPVTLVFYKNNVFESQIMHKYSGWSDENIKALYDCLLLIKPPSNDKRICGGVRLRR